jgi:hypothetical protein
VEVQSSRHRWELFVNQGDERAAIFNLLRLFLGGEKIEAGSNGAMEGKVGGSRTEVAPSRAALAGEQA